MSEETRALVPIEERQVDFYGDDITAALAEVKGEEQVYVPLKLICEYLGLDWSSQAKRLKRDKVLSQVQLMVIMTTSQGKVGMNCLPLDYLNGWLFGIDAGRVKAELREKVIRYQLDCFKVLAKHFQGEAFITTDRADPAPSAALVQIRDMGLAIAQMAEQQMELERNVNRAHSRLDQAALAFRALDHRVAGIEKQLKPTSLITDEQAVEISQAVKALAQQLTSKDSSKNHYQAVFSELYKRFGASSYKNIRADRYGAVLQFLEEWRKAG
jgi:hypothetical protein